MHFHKYPYFSNFQFIDTLLPGKQFKTALGSYRFNLAANDEDIYFLQITGKNWEQNDSQAGLSFKGSPTGKSANSRLVINGKGLLKLEDKNGKLLLQSPRSGFFGQCGEASLFQFEREDSFQYYGMGEKWTGFEHSGKTTKFWNTDVFADFNPASYIEGKPASDPVYLSIPYLIVKRGNAYIGLLLDNPHATFMATGQTISIANQMELKKKEQILQLGAESGQPNLYIVYGPSLRELTQKVQRLMGTTPLPPLWSLGYHQCRWGYRSAADLNELDAKFRQHQTPVDGLWLDIDFMDRYKLFTLHKDHFPQPKKDLAKIAAAGRRVVPIFDPGVKAEAGYSVYERGKKADAFCRNPQGQDFIGLVWPGDCVFPDFSLKTARDWWANEVATFSRQGITSAWLDVNDPAVGPVNNSDMLFDHGRKPHDYYHNQYALGMAMATRQGFLAVNPDERPFLLSRSGFTGSNKYTAIWSGDNYSNYYHLRNSLAISMNLALSGIPFNGSDIGGFAGDTYPELIRDWYKASFLLPFFRNHCAGTKPQEPWAFDAKTLSVLRQYIQLRYRLRPYLYQLFAEHEQSGEAVIRPLFYDFADSKEQPLGLIADQFMVGPHLMQAPFVDEALAKRKVVLPGKASWFSLTDGKWLPSGKDITVSANLNDTPWYVRDGVILPTARVAPHEHRHDLRSVDFHIFLHRATQAKTCYLFDDGLSFDYQQGIRSEVILTAARSGSKLTIKYRANSNGYGDGDFTFTTLGDIKSVIINDRPAKPVPAQGIALGNYQTFTWQ